MSGSNHKVQYMPTRGRILFIVPIIILCAGCAGLAAKSRLQKFDEIAKAYERNLENAEYQIAAKYLDSSNNLPPIDYDHYASIQIIQYKITHTDVSEDKRFIEQDVELQYYYLNQHRLKIAKDHQVWHYKEDSKVWMLQSGLPVLDR